MKNNKGFAISSVVYAMLILFLGLILLILGNLASRKAMFDKEKNEILMRFNGYEGTLCTLIEGGAYDIGSKYECELGDNDPKIFYVLESSGSNISLIMSANVDSNGKAITSTNIPDDKGFSAWVTLGDYMSAGGTASDFGSVGENSLGPLTALKKLKEFTKPWKKLAPSQIVLPTANQVATAGGDTKWSESSTGNGFSSATWLYDNLNGTTNAVSGIYGYWTSTAVASTSNRAWRVYSTGNFLSYFVSYDEGYGIRPVITISKSQLEVPILCVAKTTATTGNVSRGRYEYGDEYECELGDGQKRTFFILDKTSTEVSLIMSENLGAEAGWCSDDDCKTDNVWDNTKGPITAKSELEKRTTSWSKISNKTKITLPTAQQVAKASGETFNNSSVSGLAKWLCGNLKSVVGYWTSTQFIENTYGAWYVGYSNDIRVDSIGNDYDYGIRPVITIPKAQIKSPKVQKYRNGSEVYFNVTTGVKCTSSDYTETQSNIGVNSGCMKFYIFNDDGGDTLNLILDHNTTATILWNSSGSSTSGPKEALTQLKTDTENWNGTETPTNYAIDQTGQTSGAKYIIDYSAYKARFITAQEVATITGNTSWNEKNASSVFYFDTNATSNSSTCQSGDISGCAYGWLYDRTKPDCTTYGCKNNSDKSTLGYWTVSPRAESIRENWCVAYEGYLGDYIVNFPAYYGIRPVIEISAKKLL